MLILTGETQDENRKSHVMDVMLGTETLTRRDQINILSATGWQD